jgi:hypothetical protein
MNEEVEVVEENLENVQTTDEKEKKDVKKCVKKILSISGKTIECVYVAIMLIFSLLIIVAGNKSGTDLNSLPITHHTLLTVKTDSMKGEFDRDALVIAKVPVKDEEILNLRAKEVDENGNVIYEGDIISFKDMINGQAAINTHRIIGITNPGDIENIRFITKGDNTPAADSNLVSAEQVLAIYKTSIPEVGGMIAGLKENNTFIWLVIVPLAALFVYNMIVFVKNMSDMKAEKLVYEKAAALSEEEKEALRKAYLKSLEEENKK